MKDVIIWGTGEQFHAREDMISSFMEKGILHVLALVSRDDTATAWKGIPIVKKADVKKIHWERIIVAAGGGGRR